MSPARSGWSLVTEVNGQPVVVIGGPDLLQTVGDVLAQAAAAHRWHGRGDLPELDRAGQQSRIAASLAVLLDPVAATQPGREEIAPAPRPWITAADAARVYGCTEQNIRQRIARGSLTATKAAGRWWLDPEGLTQ